MRKCMLGLLLLVCLCGPTAEPAMPRTVRVDLFQAYKPLKQVQLTGPLKVVQPLRQTLPRGVYTVQVSQGQILVVANSIAGGTPQRSLIKTRRLIMVAGGAGSVSVRPKGHKARQYRGLVVLSVAPQGALLVMNEVPAREYVTIVVGSETPLGWPLEAVKAQAVLTQTRLARYHPGDALGDTTQGEVYLGSAHRRPEVSRAVSQVWGQTLMNNDLPITAFYHASCAGQTSDTRIFGQHQRLPGIEGVSCGFCKTSNFARPTTRIISKNAFYAAFPKGLPRLLSVDTAGRPMAVRFANGKTESGYAFWLSVGQKLGWDKALGLRFAWSQDGRGNVLMTSIGAGHGVGLCQHGAAQMARQGSTYRQILDYYFPKAKLKGIPRF